MRAVPLLALALPLVLAGCAEVSIEGLQRADEPREPHYEEHRGLVAPQHNETFALEVPSDATLVNATLHLVPRGSGAVPPAAPGVPGDASPTLAPAQLLLEILDPAGRPLAAATVDPTSPDVTLLVKEIALPGKWLVRLSGSGASGTVEGADYGASYLLTMEILFG